MIMQARERRVGRLWISCLGRTKERRFIVDVFPAPSSRKRTGRLGTGYHSLFYSTADWSFGPGHAAWTVVCHLCRRGSNSLDPNGTAEEVDRIHYNLGIDSLLYLSILPYDLIYSEYSFLSTPDTPFSKFGEVWNWVASTIIATHPSPRQESA